MYRTITQTQSSTSNKRFNGITDRYVYYAMQMQTAVTAYLKIKQLLLFAFALQSCLDW